MSEYKQRVENFCNSLAPQIHADMVAKGFWETINIKTKIMLIVSEIAEALEADRAGKVSTPLVDYQYRVTSLVESLNLSNIVDKQGEINKINKTCYETYIKGSVEEELADVVIRLLDYSGYWKERIPFSGLPLNYQTTLGEFSFSLTKELVTNPVNCFPKHSISIVLLSLFLYVESLGSDLFEHVQLKIMYNKTRAYKHGKNY